MQNSVDPSAILKTIESRLFSQPLLVSSADGNNRLLLISQEGWVFGRYQDLRAIIKGINLDSFEESPLYKRWRTAIDKEGFRSPLRFGRRAPEIFSVSEEPPAKRFSLLDRTVSFSSHGNRHSANEAKAAMHQDSVVSVLTMSRELEMNSKKAAHYAARTLEAHHIVEDNIFEKLQMQLKSSFLARDAAVCVLLTAEFHQRYMAVKAWERNWFHSGMDRGEAKKKLIEICNDLYLDQSLATLKTVASMIIESAFAKPYSTSSSHP